MTSLIKYRLKATVDGSEFVVDVLTDTDGAVLERTEVSRTPVDTSVIWSVENGVVSANIHAHGSESFHLKVETGDNATSCTVDLTAAKLHGKVLNDDTFGTLKVSPDQRYVGRVK